RVVAADRLDEAAVARAARVGDDDAIQGLFFPPNAAETNSHGHGTMLLRDEGDHLRRAHRASGKSGPHPGLTLPAEHHSRRPSFLVHALHCLLHIAELVEQTVDLADRPSRALRDTRAARTVDDVRRLALGFGHGEHDRFGVLEPLGIELRLLEHLRVDARQELEQSLEWAEALNLLHAGEEVFEIEAFLAYFFLEALRFFGVERFLGLLDERDDVAHLEDASGHAVGIELLERVRLFA